MSDPYVTKGAYYGNSEIWLSPTNKTDMNASWAGCHTGFRTFRPSRQSLEQQQPRS